MEKEKMSRYLFYAFFIKDKDCYQIMHSHLLIIHFNDSFKTST